MHDTELLIIASRFIEKLYCMDYCVDQYLVTTIVDVVATLYRCVIGNDITQICKLQFSLILTNISR